MCGDSRRKVLYYGLRNVEIRLTNIWGIKLKTENKSLNEEKDIKLKTEDITININNEKKSKNIEEKVSNKKNKHKSKHKKKLKVYQKIIIILVILFIIGLSAGAILLYGPWGGFRDWLITTAMSTMNHQYLATWFYSDETIQECLARNRIVEVSGTTDENAIEIIDYEEEKEIVYANEYERQILERDKNNNDYKIIKIDGGNRYSGYIAVIYDPSRIEVATTSSIGRAGQYLTDISKKTNALVAINAGGFYDENSQGSGGNPVGVTISKNKVISGNSYSGSYGMIGFNKDHKLILGKYSSSQAINNGIRDCVTFGPTLIMNGTSSQIYGNGGWGTAPRTAIGQRADGIVLFVVLDGNRTLGKGATIKDLLEIFERYGAVNASNLDGGTSTSMTVKGKTVNDPTNLSGANATRPIPSAFILKPDDSDDGDYSVVKNKVD